MGRQEGLEHNQHQETAPRRGNRISPGRSLPIVPGEAPTVSSAPEDFARLVQELRDLATFSLRRKPS